MMALMTIVKNVLAIKKPGFGTDPHVWDSLSSLACCQAIGIITINHYTTVAQKNGKVTTKKHHVQKIRLS